MVLLYFMPVTTNHNLRRVPIVAAMLHELVFRDKLEFARQNRQSDATPVETYSIGILPVTLDPDKLESLQCQWDQLE